MFGGSGRGLNRQGGATPPWLQLGLGLGPVAHVAPPLLYPGHFRGETRAMYYVESMPGFRFDQGPHPAFPVQPGFGVDIPRIGAGSGGLRPIWVMTGPGLKPQGARAEAWSASVVGDHFSNLHLGNGFNQCWTGNGLPAGAKPIGAPTVKETALVLSIAPPAVAPGFYNPDHPPGRPEPPLGSFLEDDLERWQHQNDPNGGADTVMSSLNIGAEGRFQATAEVDLDLKL